jgi:hypothetical protein
MGGPTGSIDTSDMIAVHAVFRREFAAAPGSIAGAAGDDERRAMLANYYENMLAFLEVHHSGEEELVFPLLVERVPEEAATVERAAGQHTAVVKLLAEAKGSLSRWADEGDGAGPAAASSVADLGGALAAHLDEEEATILPLAAEHLSAEEWGRLPGHAMGNFPGDKVWLIMGLVREQFDDAQRDAMLANMPPPARQMWETVGETAFGDLINRVRSGS